MEEWNIFSSPNEDGEIVEQEALMERRFQDEW